MDGHRKLNKVIDHTSLLRVQANESDLSAENGRKLELGVKLNFLRLIELNIFRGDTEV